MTVGNSQEFGYQIKNEVERDRLLNFVKTKNEAVLDLVKTSMHTNVEYAGIDNCDFLNTFMTQTDSTRQPDLTQKQTVRMFDNLELFSRGNYPLEMMNKMKRLEKEKDRFSMDNSVFDRLYKNSLLKPLVGEEKELVMKDLESNKWVKQQMKHTSVLCRPRLPR
jgi:hypothetical protein